MGARRTLGVADYTKVNICCISLGVVFLSSCASLPKVIVLHDPLTVDEHLSLGLSYELNGEYDYAIQEYSKALKRAKGDYRPLFYLGNVYYRKGGYDQAKGYFKKALRIAPENSDIHNNLAWLYIDTEEFDKARTEIDLALKIKRDPYYLDTLANLYDRIGEHEEAARVLEEAIASAPAGHAELLHSEYKLLSDVYEKLGKKELAEESRGKAEEYRKKLSESPHLSPLP